MPEPVTIRYVMESGADAAVRLHQVGADGQWVLDLDVWENDDHLFSHQHAIAGTPEVTVG